MDRSSMNAMQPFDALLAGYVAGHMDGPVAALIEAHLELSPVSRRYVKGLEALAGSELDEIAPVPLSNRDAKLAAIFEVEPERRPHSLSSAVRIEQSDDGIMPRRLRNFIGHDLNTVPWKRRMPGLREYRVADQEGARASLYWISAGRPMPHHTHAGSEITLVLDGGFSDGLGHYVRGDVAFADEDVDHRPVADSDGDCICFAVLDAPLRMTGPILRFLSPFMKG
jgi:putative transcriptional regulator